MIIGQNSQSNTIITNKVKKSEPHSIDDYTKDIAEISGEINKLDQEIQNMTYTCQSWHCRKEEAEQKKGSMKLEIATLMAGVALGFKAYCLTLGNPLCLLAGVVGGGITAGLIVKKKNKNEKKIQQELDSQEPVIKNYEQTIQKDQIKLQGLQETKQKKETEKAKLQKEAEKAKKKEAEEAKKKEEETKMAPLLAQSADFRKNIKVISETKILHGTGWTFSGSEWSYTIGQADIIDTNGNGKVDTSKVPDGNLRTEYLYDEPALDVPYEKIKAFGEELKKGIITRDDMRNLGVSNFGVSSGFSAFSKDYEVSRNKRPLHELAKEVEPYTDKPRWAIDITKGTFIVYEPDK